MDNQQRNEGLGLIENDKRIFEIHAGKEFVSDEELEGIDIEISEWVKVLK